MPITNPTQKQFSWLWKSKNLLQHVYILFWVCWSSVLYIWNTLINRLVQELLLQFKMKMTIFSTTTILSLLSQFITLATCTTYPFWYYILHQNFFYINHHFKKSILRQHYFHHCRRETEREFLSKSWFMLVLPTTVIPMHWVVCVLQSKAKAVLEHVKILQCQDGKISIQIKILFLDWISKHYFTQIYWWSQQLPL